MAVLSLICAVIPAFRRAYPYAWRMTVWSVIGCVVANIPILALYPVPPMLAPAATNPGALTRVGLAALFLTLFLGPVVASVIGYGGGVFLGIWLGHLATRARVRSV